MWDAGFLLESGCYALVKNGVVVYVGQSREVLGRVYSHKHPRDRRSRVMFDGIWIWPCRVEELDRLEAELIARYNPRRNVRKPKKIPELAEVFVGMVEPKVEKPIRRRV